MVRFSSRCRVVVGIFHRELTKMNAVVRKVIKDKDFFFKKN